MELVSVASSCPVCRPGADLMWLSYASMANHNSRVITIKGCFHEKNDFIVLTGQNVHDGGA